MASFRRYNRGHASAAQRFLQSLVRGDRGDLRFRQPAGGIDDKAAAFKRVMAYRHFDLFGKYRADKRAGKLRDVDFFVLSHERIAGKRVVMFPAGQRADPANSCFYHLQTRTIALSPDHPFVERRCDLPPFQNQAAVGVENELRIIE